jgi:hypothetical protein
MPLPWNEIKDRKMCELLLENCALDWERISPALFGALFQSVLKTEERRHLGVHYTSETNILKLIKPLFLDELRTEFEHIKRHEPTKLFEFQQKLASLKFLDPACGCGNFLVIAYRELRLLELDVLKVLFDHSKNLFIGVNAFNIQCTVKQLYGIEIAEFPAQIAQTALWLMDHQMNQLASKAFGKNYLRIPLTHSATIKHGNALQLDWREVIKPTDLSYILGNPPFIGKAYQSTAQKQDLAQVFHDVKGAGVLDFVAAWFHKATEYMADDPNIKTAFVATNSITQGEQVGVLWSELLKRGVKIQFAHRTFQWSSEAKGKAAVHCVIIGFALHETAEKRIFSYELPQSEPSETNAKNINPYLVDAPTIILEKRRTPISAVPSLIFGSMPNDGGHLLLSETEKQALISTEPAAEQWIRPFAMGNEFINAIPRYCLWLTGCSSAQLQRMPKVMLRIEQVRQHRLNSTRPATKKLANLAYLFGEIRQPDTDYLAIPCVSSELRRYIPIGFLPSTHIAGDKLEIMPKAQIYHFGVLTSAMHMAWTRAVCGRLESRYQYSITIVYNNFPWPETITSEQREKIEQTAQAVLDSRAQSPNVALATLYNPLTMPLELIKAHRQLDRAVDAAYSKQKFSGDTDRVAFLFAQYQKMIAPLNPQQPKRRIAKNAP